MGDDEGLHWVRRSHRVPRIRLFARREMGRLESFERWCGHYEGLFIVFT